MKISLIDCDKNNKIKMPNLALMKLSAWHKIKGDDVDFYSPLFSNPDRIYCSKVFKFTSFDLPNEKCDIIQGGIVLDPFMGSGTTAVVAKQLNINYIGFELNAEYIAICNKRLNNEVGMF